MKHFLTLTLATASFVGIAAAAAPQQKLNVPAPAGHEIFFPGQNAKTGQPEAIGNSTLLPALRGGNSLKVPKLVNATPEAMYGFLANTNVPDLKHAMYKLDLDGNAEFLWQDELTEWGWTIYTGWLRDGDFWGLSGVKLDGRFMGYALMQFDLKDGKIISVDYLDLEEEGKQSVFVSSAYSQLDDMVYGYGYNEEGDGMTFAKAPATDFHNVTIIKDVNIEEVCASMTYDSLTDTMYGVTTTGRFVSIDKNGNQTVLYTITKGIGAVDPGIASGMGWNPALGTCVYNAFYYDGYTGLVSLDPNAKSPVSIYEDNDARIYSVLFSTEANAQPQAPEKATFKSISFIADSLDGSIEWALPSKCLDGSSIAGTLTYDYFVDGVKAGSGSGKAGATVSTAYNGNVSNGQHTFSIVCYAPTSKEQGEPAVYRCWIGADAPNAPGNPKLTETLVSWETPVGSIHNGYVNTSEITYTVYLNGKKIGTTQDTSLSYTLPANEPFTSYTAEIQATYKGWSSPRAVSNYIQYGEPLKIPVHFRPEEKELEMMTLINVDGHIYDDGTEDTWRFTTEMGFPSFASGYNGNDWLILPPMTFDNTEKAYRFEMEIGLVHDMDNTGTYEVCIGTEPTVEAMTRVIIPESRCYHMLGDILEEFFAVPEPGVYYIGIHTITHKVSFHVSDIDLKLSDRSAAVPVGVTDLVAIPGEKAALNATVSFTMPTETAAGTMLPADKELTAIVRSYATEPGYNKDRELVAEKPVKGLPGSKQQVEIETAQNYNAITVAVESEGLVGKGTETLIYTGVVRPYLVNNLKATVSEDNMSITLTWTPPTEGEEEGEIGDSFLYVIYDYISSSWTYADDAGWDVYEYTYTVDDDFPLSYLTLGVMAFNAAGLSYHVAGQSAMVGHPVPVPWTNDLDNEVTYDNAVLVRPTEQYNDTYWVPANPAELLSPIFALPSNFAFIGYSDQNVTNRKTRLGLPKVSTAGLNDVVMSFDYWGGKYASTIRLMAQTVELDEPIVIATLPADSNGWTTYTFTLPESLQDQGWVIFFVDADIPNDQTFAMFSGYSLSSESGVDSIFGSAPTISGGQGTLTVTGHAGEKLIVSDLQGKTMLMREALDAHSVFMLPAGIYIVRAGDETAKVIVR